MIYQNFILIGRVFIYFLDSYNIADFDKSIYYLYMCSPEFSLYYCICVIYATNKVTEFVFPIVNKKQKQKKNAVELQPMGFYKIIFHGLQLFK